MNDITQIVFDLLDNYYGYGEDFSSEKLDKEIEDVLERLNDNYEKLQFLQQLASRKLYHTSRKNIGEQIYKQIELDEYGRDLFGKLQELEEDISLYLNPKLLSEKYKDFEKYIAIFATDNLLQNKLESLSDSNLNFLKDIINVLEQSGAHEGEIIGFILDNIGHSYMPATDKNNYQELNSEIEDIYNNGNHLTQEQIEKIIFLYTSSKIENISNIDELNELDRIKKERLLNLVNTTDNIKNIKEEILQYTYGMSIFEAEQLLYKYKLESEKCNTKETKKMLVQYEAIKRVVNSTELEELKTVANSVAEMNIKSTYLRNIVLHSEFRNMFLHEYNESIYKVQSTDKIQIEDETLDVYKLDHDFNMIVTCIGAYQSNFKDKENYAKYWNQPHIKHRTNPCSFIGNDNLTTATIKNVVFGFNEFEDNMLFNAYNMDANSSPNPQTPKYTSKNLFSSFFAFSQALKDNTRSQYNELMFERRKAFNIEDVYSKKQPSYIIFFEEYENERIYDVTDEEIEKMKPEKREIMLEQKRMWIESKKAAKDFGIPVVIVNREECAIREKQKIKEMLEEIKAGNEEKVVELITKFENGRTSYGESHKHIRDKYFSKEEMDLMLESLFDCHNPKLNKLIFSTIKEEEKKWKKVKHKCLDGQTSSIDFEKYLAIENELKGSVDISE